MRSVNDGTSEKLLDTELLGLKALKKTVKDHEPWFRM